MTLFNGKVTSNENYTLVPSIQRFYMVMDDDRIRPFKTISKQSTSKIYLLRYHETTCIELLHDKLLRLAKTKEKCGRYASKNSIQGLMRLSIDLPPRFHYGVHSTEAKK